MAATNNNPRVILLYYLMQVLKCHGKWFIHGRLLFLCWCWCGVVVASVIIMSMLFVPVGVPSIIRSDCGTENSSLSACQMFLRHEHDDEFKGQKSFRYGSSTTNTVSMISNTFKHSENNW